MDAPDMHEDHRQEGERPPARADAGDAPGAGQRAVVVWRSREAELRALVRAYATGERDDRALRSPLAALCGDARRHGAEIVPLVLAVKEVWASIVTRAIGPGAERDRRAATLITAVIKSYYDADRPSTGDSRADGDEDDRPAWRLWRDGLAALRRNAATRGKEPLLRVCMGCTAVCFTPARNRETDVDGGVDRGKDASPGADERWLAPPRVIRGRLRAGTSGLLLTHGVCPRCLAVLFPEFAAEWAGESIAHPAPDARDPPTAAPVPDGRTSVPAGATARAVEAGDARSPTAAVLWHVVLRLRAARVRATTRRAPRGWPPRHDRSPRAEPGR